MQSPGKTMFIEITQLSKIILARKNFDSRAHFDDMALDKRAWRCQKGHGAQEKGHGAAPCYFALDLTLSNCQLVCVKSPVKVFVLLKYLSTSLG